MFEEKFFLDKYESHYKELKLQIHSNVIKNKTKHPYEHKYLLLNPENNAMSALGLRLVLFGNPVVYQLF